ncbi:MAG TPA: MFS transporter [Pseudonocardiaceae bacterium]|jgi:MFS family permease|nr:MFS transporter [Pseudonocardiaceae bacterium]
MSRRRDLRLVCAGSLVSLFGTSLTLIALLLTVRGAGTVAVAGLFIAESAPVLLAVPVAGLLIDQLPNRRLMIAAQLLQGASVAAIAMFGRDLPAVYVFLVVLGCGGAVARPAASALVPVITGEAGATRGYALISTANSLGLVLGTGVGGVLVSVLGTTDALLIDAATYLVQAGLLLLVRTERRPSGAHRSGSRHGALAGLRHLFGDRLLATAVIGLAFTSLCAMLVDVAEVFFVTLVLHDGAIIIGLLQAAWMVGLVIGSRIAGRAGSQRAIALLLCVAECVMALAFGGPALLPLTVVTAIGYLVGGVTNAVQNVCQSALVRARTPESVRGRTFAATGAVLNAANLIGTAIAGVVVGGIGSRSAFAAAGVLTLLVGIGSLVATSRATAELVAQRTARTV